MNMKQWFSGVKAAEKKKAMPVLSFPCVQLQGISVNELISDSDLQAAGMKAVADRCDTLASVSMMDLSVEASVFGASIRYSDDEVPTVVGRLLTNEEDVDRLAVPSVTDGRTKLYVEAIEKACALITDRPVFAGVIGPFSLAGRLVDLSEAMINCYEQPEMMHKCLEKVTQFITAYCLAFKKAGANGVVMAEPAAGLLSLDLIEEFSTPYVQRVVQAVQDDSFAVIYHNCGSTIPLISSIVKTGAMGLHFGNAIDMAAMMALVPPDTLAFGNVEPAGQFRNGTPESVYAATKELLAKCGKYPNFVPSSGCDIPPLSPWANIDAFFKAVAE